MFAGVTAPLLLIAAFVILFIAGCNGGDGLSPQPPRSDVGGVCVTATPGTGIATNCGTTLEPNGVLVATATPVPPTPTPAPRSYTVQAGDTLSLICAGEVPALSVDICVDQIVSLSHLGGPDEIAVGQTLRLPPSATTSSTPTTSTSNRLQATATSIPAQPTPTGEAVATATTVAEPEPTQRASLVAVGPAAVSTVTEDTAADSTTPDSTEVPQGTAYVVQAGDSLLGICVDQVPDMDGHDCVEFLVALNHLDGPDQIQEGQTIYLP